MEKKRKNKNICVLESAWDTYTLEPKSSVKNLVDYITTTNGIKYSYNFMNTAEELNYVLNNVETTKFNFLYLAFHGKPNSIHLGLYTEFKITLDDLADIMGRRFEGYAVHFGSCAVLGIGHDAILSFKEKTGAAFVSGYEKYVHFGESSLMDMALIQRWIYVRNYRLIFEKMKTSYRSLISENSFKFYI